MKHTSKMILLSMYGLSQRPLYRSYDFLHNTFITLSPGGIRSMIKKLIDAGYLEKSEIRGKVLFHLSSIGLKKVDSEYSVFTSYKPKIDASKYLILFSGAAGTYDPRFQKLKKSLKELSAEPLMRGVYLYKSVEFSNTFFKELINHYPKQVTVVAVKEVLLGNNITQDLTNRIFETRKALSGASKSNEFLLGEITANKRLMKGFYRRFSSAFCNIEQIVKTLSDDAINDAQLISHSRQVFQEWVSISIRCFPLIENSQELEMSQG